MKLLPSLLLGLALGLAGCGGSSAKPPATPPPPADDVAVAEPAPEPEPAPAPPPPREWRAEAALTPVAGIKLVPAAVELLQIEGEGGSRVVTSLAGLKPGTYHLVVHSAAACGKNATKAGPIWPDTADVALSFAVAKGELGTLDQPEVALQLDGDATVVGHTLVLHADKKGKPGKAVACGPITAVEAASADETGDGGDSGDE